MTLKIAIVCRYVWNVWTFSVCFVLANRVSCTLWCRMPFKLKASFPGRLNERPGRGDGKSNGKCIITKVSTVTCLVVCWDFGFALGVCLLVFVFRGILLSFLFFLFFYFEGVCIWVCVVVVCLVFLLSCWLLFGFFCLVFLCVCFFFCFFFGGGFGGFGGWVFFGGGFFSFFVLGGGGDEMLIIALEMDGIESSSLVY